MRWTRNSNIFAQHMWTKGANSVSQDAWLHIAKLTHFLFQHLDYLLYDDSFNQEADENAFRDLVDRRRSHLESRELVLHLACAHVFWTIMVLILIDSFGLETDYKFLKRMLENAHCLCTILIYLGLVAECMLKSLPFLRGIVITRIKNYSYSFTWSNFLPSISIISPDWLGEIINCVEGDAVLIFAMSNSILRNSSNCATFLFASFGYFPSYIMDKLFRLFFFNASESPSERTTAG